ncbi:MAG: hypothetical protein H7281_02335 [Bacteriovorax sp.]|nr:hypothetical protein [Bacteriovorax sp.]
MEVSNGTIQFSTLAECREMYKKVKDCTNDNVKNYEADPMRPRKDYDEFLLGFKRMK